jgi:lipopolysaccharide export system protein LptA
MLAMTTNSTRINFLLLCFGLMMLPSMGYSDDREQALVINAGRASIDDLQGITTYRDNVRVQQGSMRIEADTLILTYEHANDNERILNLVAAEGKPVHFEQKAPNETLIKAQANRIEFYLQQNMLHLIGQAQVQQGQDRFSGEYMVYDAKRSVLTADGGKQGVTVTLQPRKSTVIAPAKP